MNVNPSVRDAVELLLDECADLNVDVRLTRGTPTQIELAGPHGEELRVTLTGSRLTMFEQVLQGLHIDFMSLPLLTVGESKEIRLLTPKITLAKLLPTVYSFTNNRYGTAAGTERVRAHFSAELFRAMSRQPGPRHLAHAFLGLVECPQHGPLLAEHVVSPGNLEVRVKRYHIGSPLHRYLYTDHHPTAHNGPPLTRWSRFEQPVVCFDWRHPLHDDEGRRLADEPLPDDYAAQWLDQPQRAKQLARDTFEWTEALFVSRGLKLIDICYFIDSSGTVIFGEISPDCMRVRSRAADDSDALDKDEWRSGGEAHTVLERYRRLYETVFPQSHARQPLAG